MDRVAICASHALVGMGAAGPEKPLPLLMALETDIVAHVNRRCRPLGKETHTRGGFACRINMIGPRSMTGFTPKFFRRGTRVLQKQGAHSRLGELIVHLLVTGLAGFRADILPAGFVGLFVLHFCRRLGETEK